MRTRSLIFMKFAMALGLLLLLPSSSPLSTRGPASESQDKRLRLEDLEYLITDYSRKIQNEQFVLVPDADGSMTYVLKRRLGFRQNFYSPKFSDLDRQTLQRMVDMGYLSAAERDLYLKFGDVLKDEPERVMFLRGIVPGSKEEKTLWEEFFPLPKVKSYGPAEFDRQHERLLGEMVTAVRVVRDWSPKTSEPRDLPFAVEFPELAAKYIPDGKFNFELSRCVNGARKEVFRFHVLMAALTAGRDVVDRGGSLDDSYIYVHTIVEDTAKKVFEQEFPFERLPDVLPGGHVVLRKKLSELIDALKPEEIISDFRGFKFKDEEGSSLKASEVLKIMHERFKRRSKESGSAAHHAFTDHFGSSK